MRVRLAASAAVRAIPPAASIPLFGGDGKSISTVDADGVALAAIRGLHRILQEKDCEIAELREQTASLEAMVRIAALQNGRAAP